ncbi:siderophore biosynthesis protein SbnE [Staphylococcus pseudintermedius]|nr:siderophore biosynthesis protein SbnE [Staphylococcus pseudintermedius]EGQ3719760.1 siderophore biosynthesis protein SbnE [Staphylococcus pseudintermedius]EGQ4016700.1 siderophore biosynthesis protein SbnE [Staphylococcus pseudintermedius]EIA4837354.1 siderophore biosynthesis protein SbnE [Staphylococcus pseudintermedius]EIO0104727.1 siderophore biosynthesis protein SbnE [Staphylococcus pseudintermedius]
MQNFKMNKRAEHAALERLLNIYFREKGCSPKKEGTSQWHITLKDDLTLRGKLRYVSSMGHHMYDSAVYLESIGHVSQLTPLEAIRYILEAIAYDETSQTETTIVEAVYQDICNSISRTTRYLDQARRHAPPHQNHYIASEQSLYLGHPFHPTPKSATGFTDENIEQYAPECHVAFQLHYLAVDPALLVERYVPNYEARVDETVRQLAQIEEDEYTVTYRLLPVHPYQIEVLKQQPTIQQHLANGTIQDLGQRGHVVYPTSSVRTVFVKALNIYLKLPIQVKITNFVRTNDFEQIERTLDAAEIIAAIKPEYETAIFKLMFEQGYRALQPDNDAVIDILANSAMIVREGIEQYDSLEEIHVLASLFETMPDEPTSKLGQAWLRSGLSREDWLTVYLNQVIWPMLELFAHTGISLEAHVQNTLVALEEGRPTVCYVRDLEGICVSERIATAQGMIPHQISADSPVVYTHHEAWHRFKYYVIVNHLGHLVSTLGKATGDEEMLWQTVNRTLETWQERAEGHDVLMQCLEDLRYNPTFAAKANLMSKLQERGEDPIYIKIPNPISQEEDSIYETTD